MRIQVIGAGSWGLALARLLANNGHAVRLWCREEDNPDLLRQERRSAVFLPEMRLPASIEVERSVDPAAAIAVFAVPSHVMRAAVGQFRFAPETILVTVAKGIENDTLLCMSQVIEEVVEGARVVALSGPSHAEEVSNDLPASVTAAGKDAAACEQVQRAFMSPVFRVYTSADIIGVELGGALKNVCAIAAGACDGYRLGDSAKAALITRALAEMARVGIALGADPLTFAGLSGMGDLIVTCMSRHSRNRAVGERIAAGMSAEEAVAASPMIAEGVRTARSTHALAKKLGIEMPIAEQVYRVLFENADPRQAIAALMQREARPERD